MDARPERQRLFLGLPVPPAAREALAAAVAAWTGGRPLPGRAESPDKWHLTLVFLGPTEATVRDALIRDLAAAPLGPAFPLTVTGAGAFPRPSHARVLWLGFGAGAAEVARLQGAVAAVTAAHGFAPEDRPYVPHLTLARLAPPGDLRQLLAGTGTPPFPDVTWTADRLILYWSRPDRTGSRYVELASFPLGSGSLPL